MAGRSRKNIDQPPAEPESVVSETLGGNAQGVLRDQIVRIERMIEERKAINDDIKEIFAESKSHGFDPKIMRILIRRRAMDRVTRMEQDALLDLYTHAVGDADEPAEAEE